MFEQESARAVDDGQRVPMELAEKVHLARCLRDDGDERPAGARLITRICWPWEGVSGCPPARTGISTDRSGL